MERRVLLLLIAIRMVDQGHPQTTAGGGLGYPKFFFVFFFFLFFEKIFFKIKNKKFN
jgi:hypothetical protein